MLDNEEHKWNVELQCQIVDIMKKIEPLFQISTNNILGKKSKCVFWINDNEIDRKMTSKEIEKYKIEKKQINLICNI